MRWGDFRRSDNIDDRTEADPTSGGYPSGGGFPVGGGIKLGGGALVVVVIASLLFGGNPLEMLGIIEGGGPPPATQPPPGYGPRYAPAPPNAPPGYGPQYAPPPSGAPPGYQSPDAPPQGSTVPHPPAKNRDQSKDFSAAILGSTEDVWQAIFQTM